jgi:hypothetical protein
MIKREPINFPYQIRVTDRKVHTFHILLPVPMSHDSICYEWMKTASHRISLPAVPEIVNSWHHIEFKAVYGFVRPRLGQETFRNWEKYSGKYGIMPAQLEILSTSTPKRFVWKESDVTISIFLLILVPSVLLRIQIEENTLSGIEGYRQFAKSRKRLFPAIW